MEILLRSALILGIIVVVGTALFAGARLGELMERMAGAGFADDPQDGKSRRSARVNGLGAETQHLTVGSVMGSTDVEARMPNRSQLTSRTQPLRPE